jgi:EAL domain-containing protein (putative c-di-GMP-specific phosphodiesterase class I)
MAHQHYLYFKLLLRNNLLLDIDEYELLDTKEKGLVCNFMDMQLASIFQPVLRADGKVVGREALLRAEHEHGELTPDEAFERAIRENRVVQFDRLVRIIHLVNHARNTAEHELLFLNVHPRLLNSVNDHGRTFERILHYYSVPTSRVVIEIKETENVDDVILDKAVSNYRSLGYRIAVDNFGVAHSSLERVLKLRPDIVKLDRTLIQSMHLSGSATTSFNQLLERLRSAGIRVAVEGIESARQLEIAKKAGAELLQGHYFARPEFTAATWRPLCRGEEIAA